MWQLILWLLVFPAQPSLFALSWEEKCLVFYRWLDPLCHACLHLDLRNWRFSIALVLLLCLMLRRRAAFHVTTCLMGLMSSSMTTPLSGLIAVLLGLPCMLLDSTAVCAQACLHSCCPPPCAKPNMCQARHATSCRSLRWLLESLLYSCQDAFPFGH